MPSLAECPNKAWLTTKEAGSFLGKHASTVWHWAHNGTIPKQFLLTVGARVYIARSWATGSTQ